MMSVKTRPEGVGATGVYDVIIVGAGPAGMTAAIYVRRRLLKTLVITMDIGGQVVLTENIENYLGYCDSSGTRLAVMFEQQVRKYDTEIIIGEVMKIVKDGEFFIVDSTAGQFMSRTVIVTGGRRPRRLNVKGEDIFLGKGINVSLTCKMTSVEGKNIAIVGGGNTALQRAEVLSKHARRVYLIHRRDQFRSDEVTVNKVKNCRNIEFLLNSVISEFRGAERLESIEVTDLVNGQTKELRVDEVYLDIGRDVKLDYVKDLIQVDASGRIVVDKACRTSVEGLFAAGDVTDVPYAQAIIAAGQGATAALTAYAYLIKNKDQKALY